MNILNTDINFGFVYNKISWFIFTKYNKINTNFSLNNFKYTYQINSFLLNKLLVSIFNKNYHVSYFLLIIQKLKNILSLSRLSFSFLNLLPRLSSKLIKSIFFKLRKKSLTKNYVAKFYQLLLIRESRKVKKQLRSIKRKIKAHTFNNIKFKLKKKMYNDLKNISQRLTKKKNVFLKLNILITNLIEKLVFFAKLLKINLISKLHNFIQIKKKTKLYIIISKLIKTIIKTKTIKHYKLKKTLTQNFLKRIFSKLLLKLLKIYKYKSVCFKNIHVLKKNFHAWQLKKPKKSKNVKINPLKSIIIKFNPLILINRITRYSSFRKFRIRYRKRKKFKFMLVRRWRKKRKFFYRKKNKFASKLVRGQIGDIYNFLDNSRVKQFKVNLKYNLSNAGVSFLRQNTLFNTYSNLYIYKRCLNKVVYNLALIVNYLLRKSVFKLFLLSKNNTCIYDIQVLFYRLILLFYNKVKKHKFNLKIKSKKKIIKKYYFRSISLNLFYI